MAYQPHSPMSPRGLQRQKRIMKAVDMVIHGATWDAVAQECGWGSRGAAYHAVHRELEKRKQQPLDDLLQLELAKLNAVEKELLPRAADAQADEKIIGAWVRLQAQRAKLLGLNDYERRSIELAEKRASLDETQSRLVFEFMNRVFNRLELTEAQRALLPTVVPEELGKITAPEPIDMGELDADDDDEP